MDNQKLFHVYLIENKMNKKVYVGKTSGDYRKRWKKHIKIAAGRGLYAQYTKYPIHLAIAKYGPDNFSFSILESFGDENEAYASEIFNIQKFDSIKFGYNLAIGGRAGGAGENSNAAIFSSQQILNIFSAFLNGKKGSQIARDYNCTKTTIYDILNRTIYCSVEIDSDTIDRVKKIQLSQKKTLPSQLNEKNIVEDYLSGMSYRDIVKKYNSSTFTIGKIIKSNVSQDIINKNKEQPIEKDFGD